MPLDGARTGAELAHDDVAALGDRQLDAIAQGPAGRRWVLIQAPLFGDAEGFLDATAELRAAGTGRSSAIPSAAPA